MTLRKQSGKESKKTIRIYRYRFGIMQGHCIKYNILGSLEIIEPDIGIAF